LRGKAIFMRGVARGDIQATAFHCLVNHCSRLPVKEWWGPVAISPLSSELSSLMCLPVKGFFEEWTDSLGVDRATH
jgi:hypothetical protein